MNMKRLKQTNSRVKKLLFAVSVLLLISTNAFSQLNNTVHGMDFWVSFGHNMDRDIISVPDPIFPQIKSDTVIFQIRMIATTATTVTFDFTNISTSRTFNLAAGEIFTYRLTQPEMLAVYCNATGLTTKSLHITSTEYISVFAMNLGQTTTDGTLVLPVTALGTEYYQVSSMGLDGYYTQNNNCGDGYTIVAIENGTVITQQDGSTVNMSIGQVYSRYYGNQSDLTGYKLTSNKPVAYFVTNWGATIPFRAGSQIWSTDCLYEQMMPVHTWGTKFLVPVTHREVDVIRIVASQNNTTVNYNGNVVTLNAGQHHQIHPLTHTTNGAFISSDKPVAVGTYLVGARYNKDMPSTLLNDPVPMPPDWPGGIVAWQQNVLNNDPHYGDPALAWVPPVQQSVKNVTISPFFAVGPSILHPERHFAIIITPTATKNNTRVTIGNGSEQSLPLPDPYAYNGDWNYSIHRWYDKWDNDPNNRYSYYIYQMTQDEPYYITNEAGLIILGYGLGGAESYYYLTASSTRALDMLFYVNDEHYLDVDGKIYCNGPFTMRSEFHLPVNTANPTYLRWYINGVEDVSKRNTVQWTQPTFPVGPVEIKMVVIDANNITYTKTTTIIHDPSYCITTPLDPGEIGTNQTICSGVTPAALTSTTAASGGIGTITYNWQKSTDGGTTWANADGTRNQATYSPPALTATTHYRRQATTTCGTANTSSVIITVEVCANAVPDTVSVNKDGQVLIDVLANDLIPAACLPVTTLTVKTNPTQGNAVVNGDKIMYTPNPDFIGKDSLEYSFICSGNTYTAKVYINVFEYPDNISDADCTVTPIGTIWDMEEVVITPYDANRDILNPHSDLLVGDLNDDGIPEIVGVSETAFEFIDAITIFDNHGVFIKKINTVPMNMFSGKIGMAKVKTSANTYKTIIVVAGSDDYLYAYDYYSATHIWKSNVTYNRLGIGIAGIGFADFNNDGYTEVYANNAIFDAATGVLLCRGTGKKGAGVNFMTDIAHITIAADIDGDGKLELLAGTDVYSINITNRTGTAGNTITVNQSLPPFTMENGTTVAPADGITTIADMDLDGYPDMVVQNIVGNKGYLYVWSPHKNQMLARKTIPTVTEAMGVPLIGDIDGDGRPEIVFMTVNTPDNAASEPKLWAFKYDGTTTLKQFWEYDHLDRSGFTGITLFDFNQDGISEIVFRDNAYMRIINASGKSHITGNDTLSSGVPIIYDLVNIFCPSATSGEYPIVADLGEGTRILTTVVASAYGNRLRIFKQGQYPWAPSRKVWNQYAYFSVNVNEDLTIPIHQFNPATLFPGVDGVLGTSDDQRPYNAFLQQQTVLNKKGLPMWPAPDARADQSTSTLTVSGDDLIIKACFTNIGDAAIGPHIYVTLYQNSTSSGIIIAMDSADIQVGVGESGCVTVKIPNARSITGMNNIYARINDRNGNFAYQAECDSSNNELRFVNPFVMTKNATLWYDASNSFAHNGTYPNPVSVLYNENIEYTIKAVNGLLSNTNIVIVDTIPAYLDYVANSAVPTSGTYNASDKSIRWTFSGIAPTVSVTASFKATPASGAVASQPLFINNAWVSLGGGSQISTNSTFHQGAGISIVLFSAGLGGNIYNAGEQVLDYMTTPSSRIIIAPDEGYRFAGWSHGDYTSLRGVTIEAQEGIMQYDTLTVYGNVELHASFVPEEYAVHYYLNGSENAAMNPEKYTIKSGTIELKAPEKAGDTFTGWTGSNGETPQQSVVISGGTTGELVFYANFQLSGREEVDLEVSDNADKAWAVKDDLYVRTSKAGSIVRIYSLDGVLRELYTIVSTGVTTRKFPRGIYIVIINNNIGQKIRIE